VVNRRVLFCGLGLWIGIVGSARAAPQTVSPLDAVRETADRTMYQVKAHKQKLEMNPGAIYGLVEEYVLPRFDFELISRYVLGKHWRTASPEQRAQFIAQFRTLMVRTYAHALLNYSDQEVRYLPVRMDSNGKRAAVDTLVRQAGAPDIPIEYRLQLQQDGVWRVYDVVIDGVSLVSNYRTSFSGHIRRMGLDGLIGWLDERNQQTLP